MFANPVCTLESPVYSTQLPHLVDSDLRQQGETLLRDLAFVLHLTRKVKRQILAEEPVLAGAGQDCC